MSLLLYAVFHISSLWFPIQMLHIYVLQSCSILWRYNWQDCWEEIRIGETNPLYFRMLDPCTRWMIKSIKYEVLTCVWLECSLRCLINKIVIWSYSKSVSNSWNSMIIKQWREFKGFQWPTLYSILSWPFLYFINLLTNKRSKYK